MKFDFVTIGTVTRDTFVKIRDSVEITDSLKFPKKTFPAGKAQCLPLGGKMETELQVLTGGGAANAAVTFSRQDFRTAAVFEVGKDEEGGKIVSALKKEKIAVFPSSDEDKKTAASVILVNSSGERTILVSRGASEDLNAEKLPESKWAYVVPGNISVANAKKIFSVLSKRKTLIVFNPSKKYISLGINKLEPFLRKCKVVLLNREEGSYLTGIDYNKEKEIFERLDEIVDGIVVMTDGPRGAIVSDGSHIYRAGGFREKKIADRTGAGDAFGSGFAAGLARTLDKCDALYKKRGLKFFTSPVIAGKNGQKTITCDLESAVSYAIKLGSANATSVIENVGAETSILTKKEFESGNRWKKLPIFVSGL